MVTRFATSADSTHIAFDVSGAGTPILLLHGGGRSRREWHETEYVAHLQDEFMVIRVDLRGHGESDKPTDPTCYFTENWDRIFLLWQMPAGSNALASAVIPLAGELAATQLLAQIAS